MARWRVYATADAVAHVVEMRQILFCRRERGYYISWLLGVEGSSYSLKPALFWLPSMGGGRAGGLECCKFHGLRHGGGGLGRDGPE